jgi:hypothetical protein
MKTCEFRCLHVDSRCEDWNVKKKKAKLRCLSPRANYTDQATAAYRRS